MVAQTDGVRFSQGARLRTLQRCPARDFGVRSNTTSAVARLSGAELSRVQRLNSWLENRARCEVDSAML